MIRIANRQKTIPIHKPKIELQVKTILQLSGVPDFDISIEFITKKNMRILNFESRGINKATDVLSFPFHEKLIPGQIPPSFGVKDIGDISICPLYLKEYADENNLTFDDHLKRILAHGVTHLLGYDHETDEDWKVMIEREEFLLKHLT